MASGKQIDEIQRRKQELSEKLAVSRETMGASISELKQSSNLKKKLADKMEASLSLGGLKDSIGNIEGDQKKLFLGSAVAALIATLFFKKKRVKGGDREKKRRSLGGWVKGLIVGMAVRKAKKIAVNRAKSAVFQRIQSRATEKQ